ncbi:MAG: helix-turn-helix domain-containing protein [Oscillospiraceae bacterium]|nr:helix-turn-helix domain-containing protein [Oscillospiraceae bacterium]
MRVKEAIVLRFQRLCAERKIKYNDLAVRAGITPSTVYSMMNEERRDLSVITVKKLPGTALVSGQL